MLACKDAHDVRRIVVDLPMLGGTGSTVASGCYRRAMDRVARNAVVAVVGLAIGLGGERVRLSTDILLGDPDSEFRIRLETPRSP